MKKLFCLLLIFPSLAYSQTSGHDSIWLPFKPFIGTWTGIGSGEPGTGKYERTYQWIYNGTFIEVRNKSTYPPSNNNPAGEVHEDLGYFSYDKGRRTLVLRQFHIEGFVNQYILDSISPDKKTMTFKTESIENIPEGWQAKERYRILNENAIEETFELAEPGKDFAVYSKVTLLRQK
ncbi:MAG TPA: heme-binding beta-barrel domain-containing protein [Ignavibacteriaceae bacterium]|nr:heme-binding beta-barrel domain-containing protein [Ignavibacteriaceae bacterium]